MDLVRLLTQEHFSTDLTLAFAINKSMFAMDVDSRNQYLGLGDLCRMDSLSLGEMRRYLWHMQIGWLRVSFYYDIDVPDGVGAGWASNSACLYLGEVEPISLDEMIDLAKLNNTPSLRSLEQLRERGGIRIE